MIHQDSRPFLFWLMYLQIFWRFVYGILFHFWMCVSFLVGRVLQGAIELMKTGVCKASGKISYCLPCSVLS